MKVFSKGFINDLFVRVFEMITSVKVLIIFITLWVSTDMLTHGFMNGETWASMNGGIIATVCAMREAFKVQKIRELSRNEIGNDEIAKIKE